MKGFNAHFGGHLGKKHYPVVRFYTIFLMVFLMTKKYQHQFKNKNKTKQNKTNKQTKKTFCCISWSTCIVPVYSEKRGILAAILFFNKSDIIVSVALHLFDVNDIYQHILKTQNGRFVPWGGAKVWSFKSFWYFGRHLGFCHRNLGGPRLILKIVNQV